MSNSKYYKDSSGGREAINVDGTKQVETKNKRNVQECTYPATAARNSVTRHDSNTGERDMPEC
jgi:hypothetical protein